MVRVITSLQQNPADPISSYSVIATGIGIYAKPEFLGYFISGPIWAWTNPVKAGPFSFVYMNHYIGQIVLLLVGAIKLIKTGFRDRRYLLLTAWGVSGLTIPMMLPAGLNHKYYAWALIAPVTLGAVGLLVWVASKIENIDNQISCDTIITGLIVLLVLGAMVNGVVFESSNTSAAVGGTNTDAGHATKNAEELVSAGYELQALGVTSPSEIVYVGDWENRRIALSQPLIYGNVLVRGTWSTPRWVVGGVQSELPVNRTQFPGCKALIEQRNDGDIVVSKC